MNRRLVVHLLGRLMLLTGLFLGVPLVAAALLREPLLPYLGSMVVACGAGVVSIVLASPDDQRIRPRDGFLRTP